MALGFRGAGGLLESSAAFLTIAPPAAQEDTDLSFLVLGLKGCTVAVAPTGWTLLTQIVNGTEISGTDTGSMRTMVYTRGGVTPTTTFEVTTATGTSSVIGRIFTYTRATDELYQFSYTTGSDATVGADYSATGDDNMLAAAGDLLLAFTSLNSDAGTRTVPTVVATGLVLGAVTTRANDQSSVANDSGLLAVEVPVVSGTEVAAPVTGFTNSSSSSGATVFVRLRRVFPEIEVLTLDPFSVTAGYQITATGLTGFTEYEIQRVDTAAGTSTEVIRGGGRQTLSGQTTAVASDYEFKFRNENGVVTAYRWDLLLYLNGKLQGSVGTEVRTPVTDTESSVNWDPLRSPFSWIKNCTTPNLNQPISVGEFEGYDRAGRILGKHMVLGRANPVVISDVLTGSEGTFTIVVDAESIWIGAENIVKYNQDLRLLFDTGGVYLFQTFDPFSTAIKDFYFTVETASVKRQNRMVGAGVNPTTIWEIKFIEVDRPLTLDIAASSRTWNSVLVAYSTWNGELNANELWLDTFLGD